MIKYKYCLLLILSVVLVGCVTVKVATLTDPDYKNTKFKRVLVFGNFADLHMMKLMESTTVDKLKEEGYYAIENYKLFPPLRQYSDEEKRQVIIKERLDCYLVIEGKGLNSGTLYVPSISTTRVNVDAQGNQGQGSATTVTSPSREEEVVTSVQMEAQLFDLQNGRLAWRGDSDSKIPYYYGQPMAQPDQVFESTCNGIVDQLLDDGLLGKPIN